MDMTCRSARFLSLPTTYIEWRGGRASTAAEADAGPAEEEAGAQTAMDEDQGEEDDDSELGSSSESDAEDVDIEMPSATPPGRLSPQNKMELLPACFYRHSGLKAGFLPDPRPICNLYITNWSCHYCLQDLLT